MRRVMAPCKDTLIARMGQPVNVPALLIRPRETCPVGERSQRTFCYGASTFPPFDHQYVSTIRCRKTEAVDPAGGPSDCNYLLGSDASYERGSVRQRSLSAAATCADRVCAACLASKAA